MTTLPQLLFLVTAQVDFAVVISPCAISFWILRMNEFVQVLERSMCGSVCLRTTPRRFKLSLTKIEARTNESEGEKEGLLYSVGTRESSGSTFS